MYRLPGDRNQVIKTDTVTVSEEIIQEMCQELGVVSVAEQREFCLCIVLSNG